MEHHISHTMLVVSGLMLIFVIAAGTRALTEKIKLPFTITLVFIGVVLAWAAQFDLPYLSLLGSYQLSPDMILFIFIPTLIFESAFNLDSRELKKNIVPVLTLAVPGLLISTTIIGFILHLVTPFSFAQALLLGAILSATDPVAVIALFKQLGAPKRLTVLVEGESLFNDATSLVLAKILTGAVVAGVITADTVTSGVLDFVVVFIGGLIVGAVMAWVIGWLLGTVESDPFIEITLTTVLAYGSFLVAEAVFHVSGVMATVAAGVVMGGWGRTKVSQSVSHYLEHFWEYMAFLANALIFLMVGMTVALPSLIAHLDILFWTILSMLISRALVVYGLTPLTGLLPGAFPISRAYQTVMYWGGLRGAIGLAIVLSLPDFEYKDTFVVVVTGAVLFTLIVQGLTMEPVVKKLGLSEIPDALKLAKLDALLKGRKKVIELLPRLCRGGLFSGRIQQQVKDSASTSIETLEKEKAAIHQHLSEANQYEISLLQTLAKAKALYLSLYHEGHITEQAYRELTARTTTAIEGICHGVQLSKPEPHSNAMHSYQRLVNFIDKIPGLRWFSDNLRANRVIREYYVAWGQFHVASRIINSLYDEAHLNETPSEIEKQLDEYWTHFKNEAKAILDETAELFPELVSAMQERLGQQLVLLQERNSIEEAGHEGFLSPSIMEHMFVENQRSLNALRGISASAFQVTPEELLKKVPFLAAMPKVAFSELATHLSQHIISRDETIVAQNDNAHSMFLVARGVVRVLRTDDGQTKALATLMAGDFFGEMALLHDSTRFATVKAITPCSIYELDRKHLTQLMEKYPEIKQTLEETDKERLASFKK